MNPMNVTQRKRVNFLDKPRKEGIQERLIHGRGLVLIIVTFSELSKNKISVLLYVLHADWQFVLSLVFGWIKLIAGTRIDWAQL